MPTSNPRLNLTLTSHQREVVHRLSQANGVSMASVVVELLDATMPYLERAVVVLEAAAKLKGEIPSALKESLAKAESELLTASETGLGTLDLFVRTAADQGRGKAPGSSAAARRRTPTPVASNHGGQVRSRGKGGPVGRGKKRGGKR